MLDYNGIQLRWYGHDTFTLKNNLTVCIDPYKLTKPLSADIILISHNHFDHLSEDDLSKTTNQNTIIIAPSECISQLSKIKNKKIISVSTDDEKTINNIKIRTVPAYNIDKINPDTKKLFHPKEDGKVGFIVTVNEVSIYHTGDSDLIPEMTDLKPDILLVPVSGTYVMTSSEAAKAVEKIKPKLAIPMHYGTIVGSEKDAKEFKRLVKSCEVQILTKE
jgi:L-ascorbate metabolism protein UlaG (beta-lactamase superfamily)